MKNKNLWKQTGIILGCILLFMLPVFIKNHGILIYYGDSFEEFYQFYLGGWEKVHALDFFQFDWTTGLGGNWFAYSDVYLFSPYFWLTVPFPKSWLPYEMTILNILKIVLVFQFTYLWISKISKNELTRFICGTMVAFSGWVFFYNHYTNFLDGYLMFPLLLYFAECFLQDHRYKGFVISMFALTVQSYYFAYMFMPFGCLYGLFRYLMLTKEIKLKDLLVTALQYFGLLMLGIGMGACILLPTAQTLFGNPRVEDTYGLLDTIGKFDLYKIITSLFTPVFSRLNPDYFISVDKLGQLGWGYGCSLFTLVLFPALFLQLLGLLKKKEIRWIFGFYALLGIFTLFPVTWLILQGTTDTRWFFMFVFLNGLSSAYVLDAYLDRSISNRKMLFSVSLTILAVIGLYAISCIKYLNAYEMLVELFYVLAIECMILLVYSFGVWKRKYVVIVLGVCCEIILSGLVHVHYNPPREYSLFDPSIESGCIATELKQRDEDFYRVIYDNENYVTSNEPFAKNYPGVSFYYSVYNFEQEDYLNRYKSTWSMPMVAGRTISLNQLGTKYWYTKNYIHRIPYGYEYYDHICGYEVFVNQYSMPLAVLMDKTVSSQELLKFNYFEQDLMLMNSVALENSSQIPLHEIPFEKLGTFSTSETVSISLSPYGTNVTLYLIPQDYNPEVTIEYYYQGELKYSSYFYQVGYLDQYLNADLYDEVKIRYSVNQYSTFEVYLQNHDEHWYEQWYQEKQTDFIDEINVGNDVVTMSVQSDKEQYIVTSIPYDEGWTCYVNGIESDYVKANFGFIAIPIEEGNYEVLLKYQAPWFKAGVVVSLLSFAVFILMLYNEKKTKQKKG